MSNENATTQNATTDAPADVAAAPAVVAAPQKRWGWKRISMYAGVAVVATAATYVGVKIMRKPKAVEAVADAAAAVVDAATAA